jgi:hypothetical protein
VTTSEAQPLQTPSEHDAFEAQWQRDLETLDRIERQREEAASCFFCDIADVMAGRVLGG